MEKNILTVDYSKWVQLGTAALEWTSFTYIGNTYLLTFFTDKYFVFYKNISEP